MAGSNRHDYFTPEVREQLIHDQEKQRVAQQVDVGDTGIHYGTRFAETKRRAQEKGIAAKFEELGGVAPKESHSPETDDGASRVEEMTRQHAIGSFPPAEPIEQPEMSLRGLWSESERYWSMAKMAGQDLVTASWKLVTLPMTSAKMFATRLAALRRLPRWS